MSLLLNISSILIAAVLVMTGLDKLWHQQLFTLTLSASPWKIIANNNILFAWVIPFFELSLVVMLLWPPLRKAGLLLSDLLFVLFVVYLFEAQRAGKICSCGSFVSVLTWKQHLYLNSILIALSTLSFTMTLLYRKRIKEYS